MRFGTDRKALTALANVLNDGRFSYSARNTAFMGLKKAGKDGLPLLRNAFVQVDNNFKQLILGVFQQEKDKDAIKLLESVSESQDVSAVVRSQAKRVLADLKAR